MFNGVVSWDKRSGASGGHMSGRANKRNRRGGGGSVNILTFQLRHGMRRRKWRGRAGDVTSVLLRRRDGTSGGQRRGRAVEGVKAWRKVKTNVWKMLGGWSVEKRSGILAPRRLSERRCVSRRVSICRRRISSARSLFAALPRYRERSVRAGWR